MKESAQAESASKDQAECSTFVVHADKVETARASAIEPRLLDRLEELFKIFSDPTRLRILKALSGAELCVCDIGAVLGLSQSAVSHQLALLRAARLVSYRREGKTIYYSLADYHVGILLQIGLDHASEASAGAAGVTGAASPGSEGSERHGS
jgi:ArsR family transcriptional regulator, lead/cadmium/zinc/bismuth-responsive transcriptional repressor